MQNVREFIARSMRPWRFRVWMTHCGAVALGVVTGLLGLLTGPVMVALFNPASRVLSWEEVLGRAGATYAKPWLPVEGLDPSIVFPVLPLFLVVIASLKASLMFFQWYSWEWIGERMAWSWRQAVSTAFTEVPCWSRDDGAIENSEAELGAAVSHDIRVMREYVVHFYGGLPREGLQLLFAASALVILSPKLFAILVLCVAPVGILLSKFGRRIRKRASRALADHSQLAEWIQQRLLGLETIKHYKTEQIESRSLKVASQALFQRFLAAAKLKSRTSPMIEAFGVIAMSIVLWIAFHDIAIGATSGAVVMSFFSCLALCTEPATKMGRYINSNHEGHASGTRFIALLNELIAAKNNEGVMVGVPFQETTRTRLQLSHVSIGYPRAAATIVTDFSYVFEGGKVYCLVGRSGAGKSSLFNAILGLRPLRSGDITGEIASVWAQRSLDIVSMPQQVAAVATTLARNVSYPSLQPVAERVLNALRLVHFQVDADRLSQGIETLVGPNALQLSGGQAQRLQLARLVYHHAPFVLVDEGTSALDPVTEAEVLSTLRRLASEGACVIMIAHRRAAAEASDTVLVLEQGRLIAQGPSAEVMSQSAARDVFGG